MSYHHNGGFGNGGGGGFGQRGNNGFRSNYSNQGGYGSGGGFHQNGPRINETQVPQSKHTIFIRGLHGDITTEEIQDYIGQKVGKISFDFVKVAQDRSKIFVAVRFEKRDEAKEFMETYSDREFMGCRCELSWFRDIRRYCAYQRAKQIRSNSQRRRRRSDSEDNRSASPAEKPRRSISQKSRSASRSRSRSRSPSGSPKGRSYYQKRSRSRSRSSERSASSRRSRRSRKSESSSGDEEDVESRASSRPESRRSSSRRSLSSTLQKRRSEEPPSKESSPRKRVKDELPQIPLPPKESPEKRSSMEVESPPTNPYQEYQQQILQQQSVTYSVPMEEEAPPKILVREVVVEETVEEKVYMAPIAPATPSPPPPAPKPASPVAPATTLPAFVPRQVGKIEIVMPASLPAPVLQTPPTFSSSSSTPGAPQLHNISPAAALSAQSPKMTAALPSGTIGDASAQFPNTEKLFGHLKAFQSALLSKVRYEPTIKKNEDGEEVSSLRLSSMDTDSGEELREAMEREQKLARLDEEQLMRFLVKKKQLEGNFRNDCDTYTVVTRALLSKDESLQFGLKIALLENMDDLYKKMMQLVDEHLDKILAS